MFKSTFIALVVTSALSFCDTAEDRAEAHFESGMALLEQGDQERALVEFRNVFQLNGQHREARIAYAQVERERGNIREAFGQYLRLVEQYPDNLTGQRALAELALETGNWDAARRHGAEAARLAPEDPLVQAVNATVSYRESLQKNDATSQAEAVAAARRLVSAEPDLMVARRVVIDDLLRSQDWKGALDAIDDAIAIEPENRELYTLRLGVLNQLGEDVQIREQLERMIELFPDDTSVPALLIRWHLSRGETDAAEVFLRQLADAEPPRIEAIVAYIRFLGEVRGRADALAELDRILAGDPPEAARLQALRAGYRFELGEREQAVADLEALVDSLEPSEERRAVMIVLARMLETTGNRVGARALVEEVLEQDGSNGDALKMRAGWLIDSDRTDEAIVALRQVLGGSPNDAQAMTLMARAHERAGNRDLMAEMLSRAVEASNKAPAESLRYAQFLLSQQNFRSAETVLLEAVRLAPGDRGLLAGLGEVYIGMQDWPRLGQVIETLQRQEDPAAQRMANELTARRLAAQDRQDELMGFLEGLADEGPQGVGAAAVIIRSRLAEGDAEGALSYARELTTANPEDLNARFLYASTLALTGDFDEAETIYRDLLEQQPRAERVWLALYNIHAVREESDQAVQALLDGIDAIPQSLRLNWALAGIREREGNVDGAIEIYERLYAADTNNLIIANNLASLLATARTDDESLERAHQIARRLRDRDVPAFQDTYGWIAFRRGDTDSALAHLEPAAAALQSDPTVQYHLARTYAALDRDAEALAQFRKVVEVVGDGTPPDFMEEVEAEIARLSANLGEDAPQN